MSYQLSITYYCDNDGCEHSLEHEFSEYEMIDWKEVRGVLKEAGWKTKYIEDDDVWYNFHSYECLTAFLEE